MATTIKQKHKSLDEIELARQMSEAPWPIAGRQSNIAEFYNDRSVFITGASGFVGKVLIEKLLRACPRVSRIFVLIRPKWNKQPDERFRELLSAKLFDTVRNTHKLEERIILVEGDVTLPNLGMSEQHLVQICKEVSVMFHSAATVKFDEPLKQSVSINIAGIHHMINLARRLQNLAAFVHISTAYANCNQKEIDEHLYDTDFDPEHLMQMAEWLDQETMQEMKKRLLKSRPNTYTYTKALGEWLLGKIAHDLPVAVCRPSIVVSTRSEPIRGWIDNFNGPTGIVLGAGKGMIRTIFGSESCVADLVPVDTVINLVITLGWFANLYCAHKRARQHALAAESIAGSSWSSDRSSSCDDCEDSTADGQDRFEVSAATASCAPSPSTILLNHRKRRQVSPSTRVPAAPHEQHTTLSISNESSTLTGPPSDETQKATAASLDYIQHNEQHYNHHVQYPVAVVEHEQQNQTDDLDDLSEQMLDDGYESRSMNQSTSSVASMRQSCARKRCKLTSESKSEDDLSSSQHTELDLKLKQFRQNIKTKLAAKNLPDHLADVPVFHCSSGGENPITWAYFKILMVINFIRYPSMVVYRYPKAEFTTNGFWSKFLRLVYHYLPGYIVDFIVRVCGGKAVLVRVFQKYDHVSNVLAAFTMNQWKFSDDNRLTLINDFMNDEDKRLFSCEIRSLDWHQFCNDYVKGIRRFLLKEKSESLPRARRKLKMVYAAEWAVAIIFLLCAYVMLK